MRERKRRQKETAEFEAVQNSQTKIKDYEIKMILQGLVKFGIFLYLLGRSTKQTTHTNVHSSAHTQKRGEKYARTPAKEITKAYIKYTTFHHSQRNHEGGATVIPPTAKSTPD